MNFKLPRIVFDSTLMKIATREEKKQNTSSLMNKKKLSELAKICKSIIRNGLPDYLVCTKLSDELGSGIFLHPDSKPIKKDDVIGPYSGEVVLSPQNASGDSCYVFSLIADLHLTKSEQKLFNESAPFRPNRLYAIDIDAEKQGNFIRFINHSEKPNVKAELFSIPKNSFALTPSPIEIVYVARKMIYPGEQLLISYEAGDNSYWSNLDIEPAFITPKTYMLGKDLRLTKN